MANKEEQEPAPPPPPPKPKKSIFSHLRPKNIRKHIHLHIERNNYEAYACWRIFRNILVHHWHGLVIFFTPIMFLGIPSSDKASRCMYLSAVMCVYFITGVIPILVTATLPIIAFPIMDIMSAEDACKMYFRDSLVLFATYIASAIEYSGLHIRLAYRMLKVIGCSPRRLHFGLCGVITFASMWISNTACTELMIGIVNSILIRLSEQGIVKLYHDEDEDLPVDERRPSKVRTCFFLTVAYSASIGGCGSFLGTPSNFVVNGIYQSNFENAPPISFGYYMMHNIPIVIVCSALMAINLQVLLMGLFRPKSKDARDLHATEKDLMEGQQHIEEKYAALGPITAHELSIAILFLLMVVLYITRNPDNYIGWGEYLAGVGYIRNTVPVVAILILMFALPNNYKFLKFWKPESLEKTTALHSFPFALSRVPWTLIFLVGCGAALAEGSKITGMACKVGRSLRFLHNTSAQMTLLFILTFEMLLTNMFANVTVANLTIPIVAEIAADLRIHPLWLILPTNMCLNMAFMTNAGTPANVLVRNYASLEREDMFVAGLMTTITSLLSVFILTQLLGVIMNLRFSNFPDWALEFHNNSNCFV